MSKSTAIITILLAIVLVGGGLIGYILYTERQNKNSSSTKEAVDLPLQAAATDTKESDSQLKVGGSSQQQQTQLPTPEEFEVYEQYASAPSTQYVDILPGTGDEAVNGTAASVVYTGYLTDGSIFDQSQKNEQGQIVAFTFQLGGNQVIQGWEQGIYGMKEGGKRRLIIPSQFGYGPTGQDPIPPDSMLIFDVELVQVDQQPQP